MEAKVFKPSKYQQAVYDFIEKGNGNAVIDAVAGSGKSTTIVNAINLIPKDKTLLFLAFNKAIVEELKAKIGEQPNITIKTLHQLGSGVVWGTYKNCPLNNNKYKFYVNEQINNGTIRPITKLYEEELQDYKTNVVKLVDLARNTLSTNKTKLEDIANKYQLNLLDNECEMALKVIEWGENRITEIDFTDMIYFPNVKHFRMPQFDYVFIDECQDLNTAQREMFLKAVSPNGRFIAVGDPRQAIYGFSGADVESFNILKSLPNTILLPLSVCYRCGSTIIDLAKEIVPQIEAREGAIEGVVNRDARLKEIADGDMVLCRLTAPLVKLCMQYIADGVKAHVKGKDIGINLINMIKKTNRRNIDEVIERLENELEKIANKIMKKQHCDLTDAREDDLYKSHADKVRAIEVLAGNLKTADAVINRIDTIFKDEDRSGICLSTIHKAKGLESDNVFIICEEKLLLKRAMKVDWMREQEYNLVYVAYTRAKKLLGFVKDFKCD